MKTAELKLALFRKLDQLSLRELNEVTGLFANYMNAHDDISQWTNLTNEQKKKIDLGLQQADDGLIKPVNSITKRLKKKYGIHTCLPEYSR